MSLECLLKCSTMFFDSSYDSSQDSSRAHLSDSSPEPWHVQHLARDFPGHSQQKRHTRMCPVLRPFVAVRFVQRTRSAPSTSSANPGNAPGSI